MTIFAYFFYCIYDYIEGGGKKFLQCAYVIYECPSSATTPLSSCPSCFPRCIRTASRIGTRPFTVRTTSLKIWIFFSFLPLHFLIRIKFSKENVFFLKLRHYTKSAFTSISMVLFHKSQNGLRNYVIYHHFYVHEVDIQVQNGHGTSEG